ncbi:MAG: hypothetical protein C4308_04205 [Chitinophagaceae bacterium]
MRILKISTAIVTAAVFLAGCIKERGNAFTNQKAPNSNTVSFVTSRQVVSLEIAPGTTVVEFYARLNSADNSKPATDITITRNPTIVSANGYEFLPDSAFNLQNSTVTVDPVTGIATFKLNVKTTKIDLSRQYAVGYTISSVTGGSTIAANKNTILIPIGVKNRFDGIYKLKMKLVGWAAYGIADNVTGIYPLDIHVITSGPNAVTINAPDGPFGNLQPGFTGGVGYINAATAFGATTPQYTFNTSNQLVSVVNTSPPDSRNRQLAINPAITTSRWDPATKTMYLAYIMTQNGRPPQYIYDTMFYLRPRP